MTVAATHVDVYATLTDRWGEVYPEEWVGSVEAWTLDDPATLVPWKKVRRAAVLDSHGLVHSGGGHRVTFRFEPDGGE